MEVQFSEKAKRIEEGIFALLNEKKNELQAKGRKIYNLSVGTPDFKPAPPRNRGRQPGGDGSGKL